MLGQAGQNDGSTALLNQKLDWVGGMVSELKDLVTKLDQRLQAHERDEASYQATNAAKFADLDRQLAEERRERSDLDERLEKVEALLQRLSMAYGALIFIGSAFGLSIIALVWALITGQAQVTFK